MNKNLQSILSLVRQSSHLSNEEKNRISESLIDADKEFEITSLKLDRTEKVKETTADFLEETIEAQKKELEIEAALEKVRSRSLSMKRTDELKDVVSIVFDQFGELNLQADGGTFIAIFNDKNKDIDYWTANPAWISPTLFRIPYFDHPVSNNVWAARNSGSDFLSNTYSRELKNSWWNSLLKNTDLKNLPEENKKMILESDGMTNAVALSENSGIGVLTFLEKTFSKQEIGIVKRFAKVFEQAYTRFLDLRKAEAQAKEAQIEAALERVRSRSMGMQKSEELKEVIQVVYEQFVHLNILVEHTGFIMDYKERNDMHIWLADQHEVPFEVTIPYFDSPHWNSFNEAKEKGTDFFSNLLNFEEKNKFYQGLFQLIPGIPDETQSFYLSCPALAGSTVLLDNVGLYIENFSGISYTDEENKTLMRFGKVFQQTYTRFLDLQKAEAQTREAQIEAALERVRSRSMGMQKSEELREVIQVIFEQMIQLNFNIDAAGFNVDTRDSNDWNLWMADHYAPYPYKMEIPYFDHPLTNAILRARDNGDELMVLSLTVEERNKMFEESFKHVIVTEEVKEALFNHPGGYFISEVFFKDVALFIQNYTGIPYTEAENATLMRFGRAFEQTYIRFNDLKNAETLALEAVKRASVDRVRGEIASMRTTKDLERITPLIWNELTTLGVPFIRCGVFIIDEERREVQTMLSTPDGKAIATMHVPFDFDLSVTTNGVRNWRKKEVYKEHWDRTAFIKSWTRLSSLSSTSIEAPQVEHAPENLYLHLLPFLQGMMYVGNDAPLLENELNLVQNLADAFSSAYARYEDFNKLEAAKKQVDSTLSELQTTQKQLIQSEKMASLGELTAGIAHEIQNPLNFVNNFSEISNELIEEMNEELDKGGIEEAKAIANDIRQNLEKINHHGRRADGIVKGMLQHSRSSSGQKELTDVNALVDEYIRLCYHGLRAKDKSFNSAIETDFDQAIGKVNVIPQDLGRVVLNLLTNAFYAVNEKKKLNLSGYQPIVSINTSKSGNRVSITVNDNGNGIPKQIVDKIFQPFFTTKPTGQGTGLGLSLSYDIIKAHGGEIKVETKEGKGSDFSILLPVL